MNAIAELAGVQRATIYNHFPTEIDLIDACSSHWFSENPPPSPEVWRTVSDPAQRARTALLAMYEYYDRGQTMLENVLRDTPQVPALQKILRQKWWPLLEQMADILAQGWSHPGADAAAGTEVSGQGSTHSRIENPQIHASLRVALDFFTWRTLNASGLSNQDAAKLAAAWVESCKL